MIEHAGAVMTGHNNQSLAAVVTRVSGPTPLHDWTPRPVPPAAAWLTWVVALAAAVWAGLRWRRERDPSPETLPLEGLAALALGIVLLPVAWDHYFLMLAPGIIAAAGALAVRRAWGLLAGLGAAYVLMSVPTPTVVLDRAAATGGADGLLVSHYFVGAVVATGVAVLAARRA